MSQRGFSSLSWAWALRENRAACVWQNLLPLQPVRCSVLHETREAAWAMRIPRILDPRGDNRRRGMAYRLPPSSDERRNLYHKRLDFVCSTRKGGCRASVRRRRNELRPGAVTPRERRCRFRLIRPTACRQVFSPFPACRESRRRRLCQRLCLIEVRC
jgi:hypothetical protein